MGVDRPEKSFPPLLACLVVLLALESAGVVVLVIWLGIQAAQATASDLTSGIAILVIAALCALWLVLTTIAAARKRSWMRASSITWHLLVLATAVGSFTGVTAVPQAGWVLLVVALIGIGLVVTPQVTRATTSDAATEAEDPARPPARPPRNDR
jgi:uncharacterized membrane protein YhaH (DUF805 family)